MNDDESTSLMDATGLGLLPGMAIALALGVGVIGLALIDSWWVVPVVVLALGAITGAVVFVLLAVLEDDEDEEPGLRRHVPGL